MTSNWTHRTNNKYVFQILGSLTVLKRDKESFCNIFLAFLATLYWVSSVMTTTLICFNINEHHLNIYVQQWELTPASSEQMSMPVEDVLNLILTGIQLNSNKLRVFEGFLTYHCHHGGYMTSIGSKHNSDCSFCGAENENLEHLISNRTAVAAIRSSHFSKFSHLWGKRTPSWHHHSYYSPQTG